MTTMATMVTVSGLLVLATLSCVYARPAKTHQKQMDFFIFDSKVPVTIANEIVKMQQEPNFKGSSIPNQFYSYDKNHDWRVSLEELAFATSTKIEDARAPFSAADTDSDTYLSMREFTQAPWIFEADGVTMAMDTLEDDENDAPKENTAPKENV